MEGVWYLDGIFTSSTLSTNARLLPQRTTRLGAVIDYARAINKGWLGWLEYQVG
jgi:hypothetical protein